MLYLLLAESILTHFARAESHTQTGVICPSLALLAHSALLEDSAHFARAESALL